MYVYLFLQLQLDISIFIAILYEHFTFLNERNSVALSQFIHETLISINLPVVMQEYFGRTESTEAIVYNRRFLFTRHHIDKTKGDGHKLYQENFFFIVRTSIH